MSVEKIAGGAKTKTIIWVAALLISVALQFICSGVPVSKYVIGVDKKLTITAKQAQEKARERLISAGENEVADWPVTVMVACEPAYRLDFPWRYAISKSQVDKVRSLYEQTQPGIWYIVKFSKGDNTRAHFVKIDGRGDFLDSTITSYDHAQAKTLGTKETRQLAEQSLKVNGPYYGKLIFHSVKSATKSKKSKATVRFLVPKFDLADAHCYVSVEMNDGLVSAKTLHWSLRTDELSDDIDAKSPKFLWHLLIFVFWGFAFLWLTIWTALNARELKPSWKSLLFCLGIIVAINGFDVINDSTQLLNDLPSVDESSFGQISIILYSIFKIMLTVAVEMTFCTAAFVAVQKCFPQYADQLQFDFWLRPRDHAEIDKTFDIWRQAVLGIAAMIFFGQILSDLEAAFINSVDMANPNVLPDLYNALVPSGHLLTQVLIWGIVGGSFLAIIAAICRNYFNTAIKFFLALTVVACLACWSGNQSYLEYGLQTIECIVGAGIWWIGLRYFKGNVVIYPLLIFEYHALHCFYAVKSFTAENGFLEKCFMLAIILSPMIILFGLWIRRKRMNSRIVTSTALMALLIVVSCLPALCQSEAAIDSPVQKDIPNYQEYLKQVRLPVSKYLKTMIDLVPLQEPPYDDANKILEADHPEILIGSLEKIAPPANVAELHSQLENSLKAVAIFIRNGGLPKVGFSKALMLAQRMREISDQYHAVVLKNIEAASLSKACDPFLVQQMQTDATPQSAKKNDVSVITRGGYGIAEKAGHAHNGLESIREAASGGFDLKDSQYNRGSMINGVGGSMGMSGLFNGLGGTGTNGLVDGLGFSSGLNGYVNGAGVSRGTSGMFNDMNVMSPSSGSALHW